MRMGMRIVKVNGNENGDENCERECECDCELIFM